MTITVHWWMIPIIIILGGAYISSQDNSTGYGGGVMGGFVLLVAIAIAVAFSIGHWFA
jgi:hypothetical protein